MTLEEIAKIFETILNAALQGGLFKHHSAAKQAIIAQDELNAKAETEKTAAALQPVK